MTGLTYVMGNPTSPTSAQGSEWEKLYREVSELPNGSEIIENIAEAICKETNVFCDWRPGYAIGIRMAHDILNKHKFSMHGAQEYDEIMAIQELFE